MYDDIIYFDDEMNALADELEKPEVFVSLTLDNKAPFLYCNWKEAFKSENDQKNFARDFINEIEGRVYELEFDDADRELINRARAALARAYAISEKS